jgi:hypothetical protein
VSAKLKLSPPRLRGRFFLFSLLGFLFLCGPAARADSLEEAARNFARKVASLLPSHNSVSLSVRNLSSLSAEQISDFSQVVEGEIQSRGHKISSADAAGVLLRVTLSESPASLLAIAEVVENGQSRFVLESFSLAEVPYGGSNSKKVTLSRELVWKQQDPILDLKFLLSTGQKQERIAVLSPNALSLYEGEEMSWSQVKSLPIPRSGPQSRAPRGQLFQLSENGHPRLIANFPKLICSIDLGGTLDSMNLECNANEEKELVGLSFLTAGPFLLDNLAKWDSSGSYFTGEIYAESGIRLHIDPFFSAGFLGLKSGEPPVVLATAGIDGRGRILDKDAKQLLSFKDWGSQLTTIHSSCDDGWRILATARGDQTGSDGITPYQFEEHDVIAFDQPVAMPGPVLSLGSEQVPSDAEFTGHHDGAIAVVRNLKTGEYEAYRISMACGR